MPDPTPNDGFTVNLADAGATQSLPAASSLLRETNTFGLYKEALSRTTRTSRCRSIRKKIEDEFERLKQAAFQIGENAESVVMVRQAKDRLAKWHGGAADEFRAQLDRIELFVTQNQYPAVAVGVQALGVLFALAYRMRQSYYDLAVVIRSCANHEIDQQQTREEKLNLAIGKEMVLAVMALNPSTAVGAGLAFFVEAAGAMGTVDRGHGC